MIIVCLGIAGTICVATLGDSVEVAIGRNLELLGRACLIEAAWSSEAKAEASGERFSSQDLNDLRRLPKIVYATPFIRRTNQLLFSGARQFRGKVLGVDEDFFAAMDLRFSLGRGISKADVASRRSICVIGSAIRNELFPGAASVLGKTLRTEGLRMRVIGVLGGVEDKSYAETVILPLSVAKTQLSGVTGIEGIYVRAANWDDVARLQEQVSAILQKNRPGYSEYVEVHHFPHKIKAIKKSAFLVKGLLYTALGVTLLLGGLGISNLMLAAVQERTKDIGLRKAVGASETTILWQFLAEAIAISVTGAIFGVVAAISAVEIARISLHVFPDYGVLLLSILFTLIFGVALGAAAGFVPARKASRLDAVEAMRFE
jgi:putative ABC transport system permease protein